MTEAEKIAPDIPALVTCRREMALAKTPAAQIAAMKRALTPLAVPVRHGFVNKTTVVDAVFEQADAIGLRNAVNDDVIAIAITDALDSPPSEEPPIEPSDYGDVEPDAHPAAPSVWRWHGEPEPNDLTDYLIRGLVPAQGVGLIAGQWGTFKTFAALDIAAAAITQTAFLGMPIERAGGVPFFAMEGQAEVTLVPNVYMLLRLAFLESSRRAGILDCGRLRAVHVFRRRLPMMHRAGWTGPRVSSAIGHFERKKDHGRAEAALIGRWFIERGAA